MKYQIPLRLSASLSNSLNSISLKLGISKSFLIRIALNKFLLELNESGIPQAMEIIKTKKLE